MNHRHIKIKNKIQHNEGGSWANNAQEPSYFTAHFKLNKCERSPQESPYRTHSITVSLASALPYKKKGIQNTSKTYTMKEQVA